MANNGKFLEALTSRKPLVWDGGMGTMLIARGLKLGSCPEVWNAERADDVRAVHALYFKAGADAGQSNTFGAHPATLKTHGLDYRAAELNSEGVKRVREAAPQGCFAIGDIGPSGAMLPPVGDASPDEVRDGFRVQAKALASAGADALHIETMFDLDEAILAVGAAVETGLPVIASMTYNKTPRGMRTMMGISPADAIPALVAKGVSVIGANCSIGPAEMVELVAEMRKHTALPIIAQPNAGQPRIEGDKTYYDMTAAEFASFAPKLRDAGASIIGGCCGTNPEFIAAIAKALRP